jgi:uncharacterized protein
MNGLTARQHSLICDILRRHPSVIRATLFGSRAKGTHHDRSDIDLALEGITTELAAESIRSELNETSLPQHFDVQALSCVQHQELREHINRVGVVIYQRQ